jgi:hypothetical protein
MSRRVILGRFLDPGQCQASAANCVKDQPEPVSTINRNSVNDQVTPE